MATGIPKTQWQSSTHANGVNGGSTDVRLDYDGKKSEREILQTPGTLMMACMAVVAGFQLVAFAFFTKVFAIAEGLLLEDPKLARVFGIFTLEKGIVAGLLVLLAGVVLFLRALWLWKQAHFGVLPSTEENLRRLIPTGTLIVLGIQGIFSSFFMSVLGLKTKRRIPPG